MSPHIGHSTGLTIGRWIKPICGLNDSVHVLVTWVVLPKPQRPSSLTSYPTAILFSIIPNPRSHPGPVILQVWSPDYQTQHYLGLIRNANFGAQPQTCWIGNSECEVQRFLYQTFQVILRAASLDLADTNNFTCFLISISSFPLFNHHFYLSNSPLLVSQLPLRSINHFYFFLIVTFIAPVLMRFGGPWLQSLSLMLPLSSSYLDKFPPWLGQPSTPAPSQLSIWRKTHNHARSLTLPLTQLGLWCYLEIIVHFPSLVTFIFF